MSLRLKIALVMATTVLLMVSLNAAVLVPVSRSFADLETAEAQRNGERVRSAIEAELHRLSRSALDWSNWDDAYEFAAGRRPGFVDDNLYFETLKNLEVELMIVYDRSGNILWSGAWDLAAEEPLFIPEFAPGALPPDHVLLAGTAPETTAAGIMATSAGPMLVVSSPIVPVERPAPPSGTFVFGSLLDRAMIEDIRARANVAFDVVPIEAGSSVAGANMESRTVIEAISPEMLIGRSVMNDLEGRPAFQLRTMTPREITQAGNRSIGMSLLSLLLIGLIDLVVMWLLLRRLVVQPVAGITRRALEIGRAGSPERRLPEGGGSEIGALAREFNRMLDRLSAQRADLAEARDAAERANRAKGAFLANMSHELRTPLNAVIGFSEFMQQEPLGPIGSPKYQEYLVDIGESGKHLLRLINTILDLAKADCGKLTLDEECFRVADVVADALRLVEAQAAKGGVSLVNEIEPVDLEMHADRTKVVQVLVNLLSNAVKFTLAGGVVRIGSEILVDGRLAVRVVDTGIGIATADLARVLEPFAQVQSARNRTHAGTGLGLPLSVSLMELHGGRLELASELGVGTTVTVAFPRQRILLAEPQLRAG